MSNLPNVTLYNQDPPIISITGKDPVTTTIARVLNNQAPSCEQWIVAPVQGNPTPKSSSAVVECPPTSIQTAPATTNNISASSDPTLPAKPSTTEVSASTGLSTDPTSTRSARASQTGVSGGAVAGAAIGCLIAGALIALLACFFLYRRRAKKQPSTSYETHLPYNGEHKTGATEVTTALPVAAGSHIDGLLPQPVDDNTITKELSKIRDSIKNHVQSYYHFQPLHGTVDTSRLAGLATATNINAATLAGLISSPATRCDALRLFVAWAVLSKFEGSEQQSLLPAGIPLLLHNISGKESDSTKSTLFSKWKVITGALLGANAHASSVHVQNRRQIIDSMDAVLGPFLQPTIDLGKRRDNLEMVLSRAAKLALLLFSQPGSFHMDFIGGRTDVLVVFPGLVQVVGDQGQALSRPRVLSEKEFATSDAH